MRYLRLDEVLALHRALIAQAGGHGGVRELGALESALAQPGMSFGGQELYPGLIEKAAALGHGLIANHPFMDGNKRVGHAAAEVMLVLNGHEIAASVEEQEAVILRVAAGELGRAGFTEWLRAHVVAR